MYILNDLKKNVTFIILVEFKTDDFSLRNQSRERPKDQDDKILIEIIEYNPRQTIKESVFQRSLRYSIIVH